MDHLPCPRTKPYDFLALAKSQSFGTIYYEVIDFISRYGGDSFDIPITNSVTFLGDKVGYQIR